MAILIASGVNLDLLGRRDPKIYGSQTLVDMETLVCGQWARLKQQYALSASEDLVFFQTNDEAEFLGKLDSSWTGMVLNPGAWTHTSLALGDRLEALAKPFVEVHVSNLSGREAFRQHSYCAPHARGVIQGFGIHSYLVGLEALLQSLQSKP